MASGNGQGADTFICRMDQLSQKLNKWKTQTMQSAAPQRTDSQARPLAGWEQEQSGSSGNIRSKPSLIPAVLEPSSPAGRSHASRSPSSPSRRGSISILSTYDRAKVANPPERLSSLSTGNEGELSNKAVPEFERLPSSFIPSRSIHGIAEGQSSQSKLVESPSRQASRSLKRFDPSPAPSLSPTSRLSRRSTGNKPPESNPFQMPAGGHEEERRRQKEACLTRSVLPVQPVPLMNEAEKTTDSPQPTAAFNARVEALQKRVWKATAPVPSEAVAQQPLAGIQDAKQGQHEVSSVHSLGCFGRILSREQEQQSLARDLKLTASPGTACSDETLASRVGQLEESLGRIEMMLQQVLQSIAVGDARGHAQPLALEPESGDARPQGQLRQSPNKELPRMPSRTPLKATLAADSASTPRAKSAKPRKPSLRAPKDAEEASPLTNTDGAGDATGDVAGDAGALAQAAVSKMEDGQDSRRKSSKSRDSDAATATRRGFFRWPLDIAEAREELGLRKQKRSQA